MEVKVGDVLLIKKCLDLGAYVGRVGKVKLIDGIGQLHGDWGGLALNLEVDKVVKCEEYFLFLEDLRKSGAVNMFGARDYLANAFELDSESAKNVLTYWMRNYEELGDLYGWFEERN